MSREEAIYAEAGFGARVPRGGRPAIVVVDFSYGFTDQQYATASDMSSQINRTRSLTDFARSAGFPVIYTTIAFQPGELPMLPWLKKATGMAALVEGTRLVEIDTTTGITPEDVVVVKKGASAFHATNLSVLLSAAGADTVIVTGATTSGCVRATVVDAVQEGFHVLVPRDCCADRAASPHEASLYDMDQKYADVTSSDDVMTYLQSLAASGI